METLNVFWSLSLIGFYWLLYGFLYNRYNSTYKEELARLKEKEDMENKYREELKSLQDYDIDPSKNYLDIFVEESIEPYGLIKMCYSVDNDKFIYYTDFIKSVPYKILDIIARKYVITVDCKKIYVDVNEEVLKKENLQVEVIKEEERPKDDVFVTFKTYNIIKKKNEKIKDKINNFKYGGKYSDLSSKKANVGKKITFSDYKKNV